MLALAAAMKSNADSQPRSRNGEGLQPCHSNCDLGRRGRGIDFSDSPLTNSRNAIAIATVDNISLTCVHAEPVSHWKGFSPGSRKRAVYAASTGQAGSPVKRSLRSPYGLEQILPSRSGLIGKTPRGYCETDFMKKYCSLFTASLCWKRSWI